MIANYMFFVDLMSPVKLSLCLYSFGCIEIKILSTNRISVFALKSIKILKKTKTHIRRWVHMHTVSCLSTHCLVGGSVCSAQLGLMEHWTLIWMRLRWILFRFRTCITLSPVRLLSTRLPILRYRLAGC